MFLMFFSFLDPKTNFINKPWDITILNVLESVNIKLLIILQYLAKEF